MNKSNQLLQTLESSAVSKSFAEDLQDIKRDMMLQLKHTTEDNEYKALKDAIDLVGKAIQRLKK